MGSKLSVTEQCVVKELTRQIRSWRAFVACCKVMSLLFLLKVSSQAETIENPIIQRLEIQGTQRPFQLETTTGELLNRETVARDVRRLWASGRFEDIRVGVSEDLNGVHLIFHVVEKPRYYLRHIKFEPPGEHRPVETEPGALIDTALAYRISGQLQSQWVEEGYPHAKVETEIVPVGFEQADLRVRLTPGERYRIGAIRFSGTLGPDERELKSALHLTRSRRILPGLPGLLKAWQWQPAFSQRRVEADLESLRSFYFSRGYWDAAVTLTGVEFPGRKAAVSIAIQSGPRYGVSLTQVLGDGPVKAITVSPKESSSTQEFCSCLREAQKEAEKQGRLNFSVQMEVRTTEEPAGLRLTEGFNQNRLGKIQKEEKWVALTARVETGPPYWVGRIEFQGNHSLSDSTLRQMLLLNEGELFDAGKLRRSLARINRLGLFKTVTQDQVQMARDSSTHQVDLTFELKEMPKGRWALSGGLEPLSLSRSLQFSAGSRLPNWGSGMLELSTFFASLSLLPLSQPLVSGLSLGSGIRWKPLIAVGRPYLPGQDWRSGFVLLPQAGWQGTAFSSGLMQARRVLLALKGNPAEPPELSVPVWRLGPERNQVPVATRFSGSLLCEAKKPRFTWMWSLGIALMDLTLALGASY